MQSDRNPFGLRGFLIDAPELGTLRGRPNGAIIIGDGRISETGDCDDLRCTRRPHPIHWIDTGKEADLIAVDLEALLPYQKNLNAVAEFSVEEVLALCMYRGGPHANLETYVRGKRVYQAPGLATTT